MPITYSEIYAYWNKNLCAGGNLNFPFWYWKGKKVLEIGCGAGVDTNRFIKAGAIYTGIDLIENYGRFYPRILKMNAENIDFPDDYFDLVYSFGVIHHTLNPDKVLKEVYRVVKPNGFVFLMLYNKLSFRFVVEIQVLRRILWFFHNPKFNEIRKQIPKPTQQEWLSMNTDNVGCPLSRIYTLKDVQKLLVDFVITKTWTENWGWFRMICAKKKSII